MNIQRMNEHTENMTKTQTEYKRIHKRIHRGRQGHTHTHLLLLPNTMRAIHGLHKF